MNDVQRVARATMAAKLLSDAARLEGGAAKELLAEHMRQTGTERVRVSDDDGTDLGAVSLAKGRMSARIVDEHAFFAWVSGRYPALVEPVLTVDPAWRARLLANMATLGDPVDPQTGEIVPGVELAAGDPYLTVRSTQDAKDRMATLLATTGLLQLEAGDA